jgi:hypothetical protein
MHSWYSLVVLGCRLAYAGLVERSVALAGSPEDVALPSWFLFGASQLETLGSST